MKQKKHLVLSVVVCGLLSTPLLGMYPSQEVGMVTQPEIPLPPSQVNTVLPQSQTAAEIFWERVGSFIQDEGASEGQLCGAVYECLLNVHRVNAEIKAQQGGIRSFSSTIGITPEVFSSYSGAEEAGVLFDGLFKQIGNILDAWESDEVADEVPLAVIEFLGNYADLYFLNIAPESYLECMDYLCEFFVNYVSEELANRLCFDALSAGRFPFAGVLLERLGRHISRRTVNGFFLNYSLGYAPDVHASGICFDDRELELYEFLVDNCFDIISRKKVENFFIRLACKFNRNSRRAERRIKRLAKKLKHKVDNLDKAYREACKRTSEAGHGVRDLLMNECRDKLSVMRPRARKKIEEHIYVTRRTVKPVVW